MCVCLGIYSLHVYVNAYKINSACVCPIFPTSKIFSDFTHFFLGYAVCSSYVTCCRVRRHTQKRKHTHTHLDSRTKENKRKTGTKISNTDQTHGDNCPGTAALGHTSYEVR